MLPTCFATGPPKTLLRSVNFFTDPLITASKASTDSGNGSAFGLGVSLTVGGTGGCGVGRGAGDVAGAVGDSI